MNRDRVDLSAIVTSLAPNFQPSIAFDVSVASNSDEYQVRAVRGGAYGLAYITSVKIELLGARPHALSAILLEAMDAACKNLAKAESS